MAITRTELDEAAIENGLIRDGNVYIIKGTDIRIEHEFQNLNRANICQAVARGFITDEIIESYLVLIKFRSLTNPDLEIEKTKLEFYIRLYLGRELLQEQVKKPVGFSSMFPIEGKNTNDKIIPELCNRIPIWNKDALTIFIETARSINGVSRDQNHSK